MQGLDISLLTNGLVNLVKDNWTDLSKVFVFFTGIGLLVGVVKKFAR